MIPTADQNNTPERATLLNRINWRMRLIWKPSLAVLLPIFLLPLILIEDNDTTIVNRESKKSTKFRAAYTILIVAVYWMFEVMPLAVTSLLPIVLFPVLGVLSTSQVAPIYFKATNVMFFGGLVLALAFQYCKLHKRVALRVMTIIGCSPVRLLFGVMSTSAFLSMWMSNTACTAMMLPILRAVLDQLEGVNTTTTLEVEITKDQLQTISRRESMCRRRSSSPKQLKEDSGMQAGNLDQVVVVQSDVHSSTEKLVQERKRWDNIRKMYMFGVAYAANLGGTATITGTGPNLVFQEVIKQMDVGQGGKYLGITFTNWMALNVPATIFNVVLTFVYLICFFYGVPNWREWPLLSTFFGKKENSIEQKMDKEEETKNIKNAEKLLRQEYLALGSITFHEIGVLVIFILVVLLWIFRDPKFITGWNNVLDQTDIGDATAAIFGVVLMFLIPKDMTSINGNPEQNEPYQTLLDWNYIQKHLPWGVILLLGGGFALSEGADKSGLSAWIGDQLIGLENLPTPLILFVVMVLTATITEVCSNVATANVILPILLQLSRSIKVHPLYLTVPATISCSFAFMLPVATPPNALVFSAGNLRIKDMIKTGIFLNIACILMYFLIQITYGELLFSYENYQYPNNSLVLTTGPS